MKTKEKNGFGLDDIPFLLARINWRDARIAELEAENERLQLKLRNVRLWLDSVGFAGSPSTKLTACTQRDLWRLSLIASPKQDTAAMETTP